MPWWVVAALAGVVVLAPAWMLIDDLRNFSLFGDDFAYIAESRDWPTAWSHLLEPHNTHVVPLFRLWTFLLIALTGRLANLPVVFAAASYFGLIAAMLALGHLVARETRQTTLGLLAMAMLGISTVSHPAVTWFSAGQALWAGTAIIVTISLARSWCAKGGSWRFSLVALGTLLAPAIWSGGLVAGPAAIVYVWSRKSWQARWPVVVLMVLTVVPVLLVLFLSQRHIHGNEIVWEQHRDLWPRPIQAVLHTAQALVEVCLFGNLGLDAVTTPRQAVALLIVLTSLWAWSRGGVKTTNALEATGAAMAVASCLLVYAFRGNLPYSSLRTLGWYHAIPQMGAILFVAGWWSALNIHKHERMSLGQTISVLSFVVVFCLIQIPRGQQILLQGAPPFTSNEALSFPSAELRGARALYFKAELHDRQVRTLARLDRVDAILAGSGTSPETLRELFGRVLVPGIPEKQLGADAFSLLKSRPENANALQALTRHRAELKDLLRPEVPPTPFWLDPKDPLSRTIREGLTRPKSNVRPR